MTDSIDSSKDIFQRKCSIIISLIASMLLIDNLGSQNASSSATFLNASAINTYGFYQAKSIRQNDLNISAFTLDSMVTIAGKGIDESTKKSILDQAEKFRLKAASYDSDAETGEGKKELLAKSKLAEKARDEAMEKGPYFDFAGLLLQLAIILISVVLITERRTLYLTGLTAACIGTFLSLDGFFLFIRLPLLS